jgi:hypothetical protein
MRRPVRPRPDAGRGGAGGDPGGAGDGDNGEAPCADDAREAGGGGDDLEHALALADDLGRDLRLCPGDPDHRRADLRLRTDATVTWDADGPLSVEVRGPGGLYAAGRTEAGGGALELAPVPLRGRYYLSFFADAPRTYRLDLTLAEGGCPEGAFARAHTDDCVDAQAVCDDSSDCPDSTDELGCGFDCLDIEFACADGSCIPRGWRCDGGPDCPDGEDERSCAFVCPPSELACPDEERCLPPDLVCDGDEDCADGTDEARCAQDPRCDPAYPDVCVPPFPPDVDCTDAPDGPFRALPADPHGLDFDRDGLACEAGEL